MVAFLTEKAKQFMAEVEKVKQIKSKIKTVKNKKLEKKEKEQEEKELENLFNFQKNMNPEVNKIHEAEIKHLTPEELKKLQKSVVEKIKK